MDPLTIDGFLMAGIVVLLVIATALAYRMGGGK